MKKKKRIALALAAALMMVLLLAACSDKTIRLGVAGIGGVYQVFGEDYAALQAQNGGRKLEVRETAGSAASLRLLSSGYLQMAVVQADMAQDAYNQTGAFAESEVENNFSTVAVLYRKNAILLCGQIPASTPWRSCKARPSALARKNPARSRTPNRFWRLMAWTKSWSRRST